MPCLIKLRIEMRGTQKIYTRKMSRQIQAKKREGETHENKRILVSFNWIKICMTFKQIKIEAQKKFYIEEFFSFRAARMRMGNFQIGQIVNQNCKPYHNCYLHARPLTIRVFFFWCTFFFSLSSMAVLRLPNWKMLMLTHAVVVVLSLSEKKYSYNG